MPLYYDTSIILVHAKTLGKTKQANIKWMSLIRPVKCMIDLFSCPWTEEVLIGTLVLTPLCVCV